MSTNVFTLPTRPSNNDHQGDGQGAPGTLVTARTASPAVYTVMEVAHLLSLSRGSTYAMVRSGDIPALKLGNRWVIPKRRFHQWLDGLREPTLEELQREFSRTNGTEGDHN